MRHSIHHPEKSLLLLPLQTSFWREGGELIGNDPDPPSFTVGWSTSSISKGFRRSEMFVAGTKRTVFFVGGLFNRGGGFFEIVRSLRTLCCNDAPLFGGWILSQLRHGFLTSSIECGLRLREPPGSERMRSAEQKSLPGFGLSIQKSLPAGRQAQSTFRIQYALAHGQE